MRLALESSRQLALKDDTSCWYAKTNLWFQRHGFSMDRLPPFQYSLEAPSLPITKTERNRIIRQDLIQLDTKRTWVEPIQELGTKMAFYRGNFLQVSEDGFVTRPSYMDTHLSHGLRCAIGQICTSSHHWRLNSAGFRESHLKTDSVSYVGQNRRQSSTMYAIVQFIMRYGGASIAYSRKALDL